jgi:uncharacterized membrane protein YgcG
MTKYIYDILEDCLQSIEHGANVDSLLARYPQFADELRPLLKAALSARAMPLPSPSASGMRRGRAQFLQKAAEMREAKIPHSSRRSVIPLFQRLAIALGLTSALVFSGTGLVSASSTALPGENLYPVKRTWEDVRLLFVFNVDSRDALESQYEQERLHEATKLLAEGRYETIEFVGVYQQLNGKDYVSGIPVLFSVDVPKPSDLTDGVAVAITGRTNTDGFIVLETIALLPFGYTVPVGQSVGSEDGEDKFKIEGVIDSLQASTAKVNGQTIYLDNAQIEGVLVQGAKVEAEGYYAPDGKFIVTTIEVKDSGSLDSGSDNNSGSGGGSDSGGEGGDSGSSDGGG